MSNKKVAICGAGLSGLACAMELKNKGIPFHVFEKTDRVGGRVKTDHVDGFLLEHGFQVFLTSYQLGPYFLDYSQLQLQNFSPGAQIFHQDQFRVLSDPLRDPQNILPTLFSPLASLKDKFLTLKLIFQTRSDYGDLSSSKTAMSFLESFGFSQSYIKNFFIPFFSGVFLTKDLSVSSQYFSYLFNRFSKANATLPLLGMEQIPKQMSQVIGDENITLNSNPSRAELQSQGYTEVVEAFPSGDLTDADFFNVTTHYFKTTSTQWVSPMLYLNGDSTGPVNHVACLTAVSSEYAPKGWHLFSVNVLEGLQGEVKEHLKELFGFKEVESWELIRSYAIKRALPKRPLYGKRDWVREHEGLSIYSCGDFMESASIQGALTSGKKTAEVIAQD
jgi:hypothetical protein